MNDERRATAVGGQWNRSKTLDFLIDLFLRDNSGCPWLVLGITKAADILEMRISRFKRSLDIVHYKSPLTDQYAKRRGGPPSSRPEAARAGRPTLRREPALAGTK